MQYLILALIYKQLLIKTLLLVKKIGEELEAWVQWKRENFYGFLLCVLNFELCDFFSSFFYLVETGGWKERRKGGKEQL